MPYSRNNRQLMMLIRSAVIAAVMVLSCAATRAESFPETLHVTSVRVSEASDCWSSASSPSCETTYVIEGYMKDVIEGHVHLIAYTLHCKDIYGLSRLEIACPTVHAGHDYFVMRKEFLMAFSPDYYGGDEKTKRRGADITAEVEITKEKLEAH